MVPVVTIRAPGDEAVNGVDVQQSIVVEVRELSAPAPAAVEGSTRLGHVSEPASAWKLRISNIEPKHVALVGFVTCLENVRNVDVQVAVIVDVAHVNVHSLPPVVSDSGMPGWVDDQAKPRRILGRTRVEIKFVRTEVVREVEVGPTVVVQVARSDGQCPPGEVQTDRLGAILEGSVPQVAVQHVAPAVVRVCERFVHHTGRHRVPQIVPDALAGVGIHNLLGEVVTHQKIESSVSVIVQKGCSVGVAPVVRS